MKGELIFRLTCLTEINLIKFAFKSAQRGRALIKNKQFIFHTALKTPQRELKRNVTAIKKKIICDTSFLIENAAFIKLPRTSRSRPLQLRLDKNMMGRDLETVFYFPTVLIFTMVEFNIVKCYSRQ